jgi:hypothetical protein
VNRLRSNSTNSSAEHLQIVDRSAASIPGFEPLPIEANHNDISKFESRQEKGYKAIIIAIKQVMAEETPSASARKAFDNVCDGGVAVGGRIICTSTKLTVGGGSSTSASTSLEELLFLSQGFVVASPEVAEVCKPHNLLQNSR